MAPYALADQSARSSVVQARAQLALEAPKPDTADISPQRDSDNAADGSTQAPCEVLARKPWWRFW
jgi:hypothetical protein